MTEDAVIPFIQEHMLKAGESIDELSVEHNHALTTIPIIKQTARAVIKTAEIVYSQCNLDNLLIPKEVSFIFHSPNVKKKETELLSCFQMNDLIRFLEQGFIIKETRFKKDGRTVHQVLYRMGYAMYGQLKLQEEQIYKQDMEIIQSWVQRKTLLRPSSDNQYALSLLYVLNQVHEELQMESLTLQQLSIWRGKRWRKEKMQLFLDFLLAVYEISSGNKEFDWKEIGAAYYRKIGGSKMFDAHKGDFLDLLEQILKAPPYYLGLVSLGSVTSILFCGHVREGELWYPFDTVRAITDLAVFQNQYKTDAETLWLVENRAVLTRMAANLHFLQATKSLVIGLDGQLRSGHRKFIQSLLEHSSSLQQAIIWTDFDKAGSIIGRYVWETVQPFHIRVKWVMPDAILLTESLEEYEQAYLDRSSEQEEQLGGVEQWRNWLKV